MCIGLLGIFRYPPPSPVADISNDSLSARDIAYHMHPFTNARRLESEGPFVITRGNGIRIFDEQGRDYIDALAGLWCASLGFSEVRLAEGFRRLDTQ